MKNVLFLAVALVGNFAHASHTVCSSPTLYYSAVRGDFGTQPPPGSKVGSLTIFGNGKLLVDETYFQGMGGFHTPQYGVTFIGPKVVLASSGVEVAGSTIYTDNAVLSTVAPFPQGEVLRTPVVCEQTWAFVP